MFKEWFRNLFSLINTGRIESIKKQLRRCNPRRYDQIKLFYKHRIRRLGLWLLLLSSRWLFVLQVKPLRNTKVNKVNGEYYPPPGYGVPPGYLTRGKEPEVPYGLFLIPANITKFYAYFVIVIPFLCFIPFIIVNNQIFIFSFLGSFLAGFVILRFLIFNQMPIVLYDICRKWPISAYRLFLSVPHDVYLKYSDIKKEKYLFWNPDGFSQTDRQPAEFSYKNNSLQEVILSMAIFEILFREKEQFVLHKSMNTPFAGMDASIKTRHWLKLVASPVIISYVLMFIALFTYFFWTDTGVNAAYYGCKSGVIYSYPTNFMIASFAWILGVVVHVGLMQRKLFEMHNQIRNGYYNSQLEKVPQRLLDDLLMKIPDEEVINQAINSMSSMMKIAGGVMFLGFLGMIEIMSQVVC